MLWSGTIQASAGPLPAQQRPQGQREETLASATTSTEAPRPRRWGHTCPTGAEAADEVHATNWKNSSTALKTLGVGSRDEVVKERDRTRLSQMNWKEGRSPQQPIQVFGEVERDDEGAHMCL